MKKYAVISVVAILSLTACSNDQEADDNAGEAEIADAENRDETMARTVPEVEEHEENPNSGNVNNQGEEEASHAAEEEAAEENSLNGNNQEDHSREENDNEEETSSEVVYDSVVQEVVWEAAVGVEGENYMRHGIFTGGEQSDAKGIGDIDYGMHEGYERIVFDIHRGSFFEIGDPIEIPSNYEVKKESYPARLVYTLDGHRATPEEIPDLSTMDYFSYMEIIPLFDDMTIMMGIYLQEPVEFEVFELHNPAKMVTDVRPVESRDYAPVYSIRTRSIPQEGNIGDIEQQKYALSDRGGEQVRTLHAEDGTLMVEEGYYATLAEAEERKTELDGSLDFPIYIEKRGMYEFPENIQ